jgi:hypothetical protein
MEGSELREKQVLKILGGKSPEVPNYRVNLDCSCLRTSVHISDYLGIQRLGDLWCSVEKYPKVLKSQSP